MELTIINQKLAMDSRDIAKVTGKQHKQVLRDIDKMLPKVTGTKVCRLMYTDKKGELRPHYCLPHRELLILLTGYSVELRTAVIDRWAFLERNYNSERAKSIETRKLFTDDLQDHGYEKPGHYIKTTTDMKSILGITHKKKDMTAKELKAVRASEAMASLMLSDEYGFYEVNPVCLDATRVVITALSSRKQRLLA